MKLRTRTKLILAVALLVIFVVSAISVVNQYRGIDWGELLLIALGVVLLTGSLLLLLDCGRAGLCILALIALAVAVVVAAALAVEMIDKAERDALEARRVQEVREARKVQALIEKAEQERRDRAAAPQRSLLEELIPEPTTEELIQPSRKRNVIDEVLGPAPTEDFIDRMLREDKARQQGESKEEP